MEDLGAHESASLSQIAFHPFGVMYGKYPRGWAKANSGLTAGGHSGTSGWMDGGHDQQLVLTHWNPPRNWVPMLLVNNGQNDTAATENFHVTVSTCIILSTSQTVHFVVERSQTNSPTWAAMEHPSEKRLKQCAHGAPLATGAGVEPSRYGEHSWPWVDIGGHHPGTLLPGRSYVTIGNCFWRPTTYVYLADYLKITANILNICLEIKYRRFSWGVALTFPWNLNWTAHGGRKPWDLPQGGPSVSRGQEPAWTPAGLHGKMTLQQVIIHK